MTGADDPLGALARALTIGHKPTAWLISHGSSLGGLWTRCRDARTLLAVAARAASPPVLVRATCACARAALESASATEAMEHALRTAEAWTGEQATLASLEAACRPLESMVTDGSSDLAACVFHAAAAAFDPLAARDAADAAARVLSRDAGTIASPAGARAPTRTSMAEALAALASIVRTHMACPSLDALLAGAGRRGSRASAPAAKRR